MASLRPSRLAGGGLCRLPDFSGPAPDLASLVHEFGSGRPPQWSMALMGGDSDALRLALGDVGARHIPPGWHGPSRIGTRCLLLVARAAPWTACARDRGTSPM